MAAITQKAEPVSPREVLEMGMELETLGTADAEAFVAKWHGKLLAALHLALDAMAAQAMRELG